MLETVKKTIEHSSMFKRGDHLLVAVSGGPDSIALLRVLILLSSEYRLHLTTAHLNHNLRGEEAKEEADFVRRISDEMGIPCICKTVDIGLLQRGSGRSLEEVGREERYRFLNETAQAYGAQKIATGHHRNDQAETILINLIRGSGLEGLKGMGPMHGDRIVRPLYDVTRQEIIDFLHHEGLAYRVDSSNLDPAYLRNRIRNDLIPELAARYNPQIVSCLCRMAEIIRREDDYLQNAVHHILHEWGVIPGSEAIHFPTDAFLGLHDAIQGRIIKCLLEAATPSGQGISFPHIEAVLTLVRRSSHRRRTSLDLPSAICVEKEMCTLRICRRDHGRTRRDKRMPMIQRPEYSYPIEVPGSLYIPEIDRQIRTALIDPPNLLAMKSVPGVAFLDSARIFPPLVLRNVKPGDRIRPLGMEEEKRIKSFFIDRKIPREIRVRIPLLVDSRSVIWIAGVLINERVKVTERTNKVLRAEMV